MRKKRYTREDLTEKQREFIDVWKELGGSRLNATTAYGLVYGNDNKQYNSRSAGRLLRDEKVAQVIADETVSEFAVTAVIAAEQLGEVLTTGMWHGQPVKPNDGLKAMAMAMERGLGPIAMLHKHEHTHEVQAPPKEELIPAILQEIGKLPDAQRHEFLQMLANEDNVIDVEAVSIDPDAPWGRKKDGTPKAKPGVKEKETPKHLQTAYAIEDNRTELQKRLDSVKAKKLAKLRKEATSE